MNKAFMDRLAEAVVAKATPLVVGLDPRWKSLPQGFHQQGDSLEAKATAYRDFCLGIIDVVAPLAVAVKPQVAFFEQLGWRGMQVLDEVMRAAQANDLLVILDAKRNDIGSTAEGYAEGWLGADSPWGADSLTISPYLGDDSLEPFVRTASQRNAGLFILVKTSNPGGKFLQDLPAGDGHIYNRVGGLVERLANESAGENGYGVTGAVVGATYPEQLAELRGKMPHTWFLVPGFGSQGGTAEDVAPAFDERGLGAVVNSSRGIIFAHARKEIAGKYDEAHWQRAVEDATLEANQALGSVAGLR